MFSITYVHIYFHLGRKQSFQDALSDLIQITGKCENDTKICLSISIMSLRDN